MNDINEVEYTFKTSHGGVRVKPSDIITALNELSSQPEPDNICPPEEDLQGWSIINAMDEEGKSRPLFLMRVLPNNNHPPYGVFHNDDETMRSIILENVYKLTPAKIKWIKFKTKMRNIFEGMFKIRIRIEKKG